MAYCTEAQVQAEFKELPITATSALKTAQIAEFIAEADSMLNAIIGTRYVVPVTAGNALVVMRMLSRALVANRVAGVLAIKTGVDKINQEASRMKTEEVLKMAREIAAGKIDFAGASSALTNGGVDSYTSSNDVERTFNRNTKQW